MSVEILDEEKYVPPALYAVCQSIYRSSDNKRGGERRFYWAGGFETVEKVFLSESAAYEYCESQIEDFPLDISSFKRRDQITLFSLYEFCQDEQIEIDIEEADRLIAEVKMPSLEEVLRNGAPAEILNFNDKYIQRVADKLTEQKRFDLLYQLWACTTMGAPYEVLECDRALDTQEEKENKPEEAAVAQKSNEVAYAIYAYKHWYNGVNEEWRRSILEGTEHSFWSEAEAWEYSLELCRKFYGDIKDFLPFSKSFSFDLAAWCEKNSINLQIKPEDKPELETPGSAGLFYIAYNYIGDVVKFLKSTNRLDTLAALWLDATGAVPYIAVPLRKPNKVRVDRVDRTN